MTTQHIRRVIAGSLLTFGLVAIAPVIGRAQNTPSLPLKGQRITVVGCLVNGKVKGHDEKLVLAKATAAPIKSVPEATCTASDADTQIRLQDMKQAGLDGAFAGHWMEISGRLESQHGEEHKVREIHVKSFKPVPVVPPPVVVDATLTPFEPKVETPVPSPIPEQPVATAGVRTELPKTATSLPLFGLIGFVSLCAGFGVHLLNRGSLEQG